MNAGRTQHTVWTLAVAASLLALAPRAAMAQHQMPSIVRIDASDPTVKRATGLLDLMIAGGGEMAESYLKEHVAAEDLARVTGEMQPLAALLSAGGFRLRDFVEGPEEGWIIARLVGRSGEPELIGFLIPAVAPHRIQRLFHVRMQHG